MVLITTTLTVIAVLTAAPFGIVANEGQVWVATWSTAPVEPNTIIVGTSPSFDNVTLRQIVHTSIGGAGVRVRLSTFGAGALGIGEARIALRATGSAIVPGTDQALTFGGLSTVVIPPGAVVLSDPVALDVPPLADLAVSIFVPGNTGPATWHFEALQTSYVSIAGNHTDTIDMPFVSTTRYPGSDGRNHDAWFWLAGVEVLAPKQSGAVAVVGDSVTDGSQSTPDTNSRWPDLLAQRLAAVGSNHHMGVLNLGVVGNRLLNDIIGPNALARYERDVLAQSGVTHVITALGNNDILFVFSPADVVSVDQIVAGYRQLIRRARARGLKIYGATLTPFGGFPFASPAKENQRQAVNHWIRTSGEYDAVIDFDAVLRDPNDPTRLRSDDAINYDSGDHLHPNDAGYQAMANAIDLALFKTNEGQ
jgi:lysophospholipase L1-like esterase